MTSAALDPEFVHAMVESAALEFSKYRAPLRLGADALTNLWLRAELNPRAITDSRVRAVLKREERRPSFLVLVMSVFWSSPRGTVSERTVKKFLKYFEECGLKVTLAGPGRPTGSFKSKLAERVCEKAEEADVSLAEACNMLKIYGKARRHRAMEGARKRLNALRKPVPKRARAKKRKSR